MISKESLCPIRSLPKIKNFEITFCWIQKNEIICWHFSFDLKLIIMQAFFCSLNNHLLWKFAVKQWRSLLCSSVLFCCLVVFNVVPTLFSFYAWQMTKDWSSDQCFVKPNWWIFRLSVKYIRLSVCPFFRSFRLSSNFLKNSWLNAKR